MDEIVISDDGIVGSIRTPVPLNDAEQLKKATTAFGTVTGAAADMIEDANPRAAAGEPAERTGGGRGGTTSTSAQDTEQKKWRAHHLAADQEDQARHAGPRIQIQRWEGGVTETVGFDSFPFAELEEAEWESESLHEGAAGGGCKAATDYESCMTAKPTPTKFQKIAPSLSTGKGVRHRLQRGLVKVTYTFFPKVIFVPSPAPCPRIFPCNPPTHLWRISEVSLLTLHLMRISCHSVFCKCVVVERRVEDTY